MTGRPPEHPEEAAVAVRTRSAGPRKIAAAAAYHRGRLEALEAARRDPNGCDPRPEVVERHREQLAYAESLLDRAALCRCCGRHLTDPVSVARRVGPECIRKPEGQAVAVLAAAS